DSLHATLLTGSHETQTLRILNSGGSPLDFSLKVRPRSPAGGACVATHALVTEFSGGELSRVDLATGSVTQVVGGLSAPVGIVLEPTGNTALVLERDRGVITRVDLATGSVSGVASGLNYPRGLALDPTGHTAYTGELETGRLMAVDLSSGALRLVASGLSRPTGIAVSGSGDAVYV